MKKTLLFCFVFTCFFCRLCFAQGLYLQDVSGRPILSSSTYENVIGSPYLFEDWAKGRVTLSNSKTYQDVLLKYDQVKDEVIYKSKDGNALIIDDIKEFKLTPNTEAKDTLTFRRGFPAFKGNGLNNYYQVLVDLKTKLLKKESKIINNSKEFNSPIVNKTIMSSIKYYTLKKNGDLILLSKDKKSILTEFPDKSPELNSFISTNNLNLKSERDLIKLIAYYNGL